MSRLRFNKVAAPTAPAGGKLEVYASLDTPSLIRTVNEANENNSLTDILNYSVAAQSIAAATRTYVTGSKIAVPVTKLKIGTILRWTFNITKTAAGIALSTYDIAFGTLGTTGDVARVSFTKPAGSAAADEGRIQIIAIVRGPLSASGIVVGEFTLIHNLASTGHAIIPCVVVNTVSGAFDVTTPTFVGICITSGASDVITIQLVAAEAINL